MLCKQHNKNNLEWQGLEIQSSIPFKVFVQCLCDTIGRIVCTNR